MAPDPSPNPTNRHPGDPAKMPKTSAADIASTVLEQWNKDTAGQAGFRSGQSVSPGKAQGTLEISSFLQVPAILKAIENGESIRLKFPEPAPGTPDADKVRAEQKEIRDFIKSNSSKPFSQIQSELAAKIEGCLEFAKVARGSFTGQDWISAHSLNSKSGSLTLNVTSVYRGDTAISGGEPELNSLMLKLEPHIADKAGSQAILTVDPANAEALADAISQRLEARGSKAKGLKNVTVWVGASNDPFNGKKLTDSECKGIQAMPLDEFLKRFGNSKNSSKNAEETPAPTPTPAAAETTKPWQTRVEPYKQKYYVTAV